MSDHKRRSAQIWLPYFKQGDDMNGCIVKDDNGVVDTKESIRNHIQLLNSAIEQLQKIYDSIPDMNTCSINGDTHHIGIEGDERIINFLNKQGVITINEWDNESEDYGFAEDLNNLESNDE